MAVPNLSIEHGATTYEMDTSALPVGEVTKWVDQFSELGKACYALGDLDAKIAEAAGDPINLSERRAVVANRVARLVDEMTTAEVLSVS